ncbi:GNAT family N-acetyltransferase [Ascidiimonas sp. W6]|uniref:GNAT family N-acetyltransferase n=1 Tax=Ascidiimonas meishanensis TaxID=3128903 RepID=UPI0030EF5611
MTLPLTTNRLRLEEASLKDGLFFYELLNTPSWITYIGDRNIKLLKDAEAYIKNSLIASYKENGFGLCKVSLKETNTPIGICGLMKRNELSDPDLGFAILPEYERKGYTLEASKSILEYSKTLKIDKLLAITTENNEGSKAILLKLGFLFEGVVEFSDKSDPLLLFKKFLK